MEKQLKIIAIGTSIIASYYAIKMVSNLVYAIPSTIRNVKHEVKKIIGKAKAKETEGKRNENIMGFHI